MAFPPALYIRRCPRRRERRRRKEAIEKRGERVSEGEKLWCQIKTSCPTKKVDTLI